MPCRRALPGPRGSGTSGRRTWSAPPSRVATSCTTRRGTTRRRRCASAWRRRSGPMDRSRTSAARWHAARASRTSTRWRSTIRRPGGVVLPLQLRRRLLRHQPALRGDGRALAQPARPLRADGDGEGVDQQRDRRPQRRLEGPRVITRSSATRAATTGSCTTPSIRPTRCRAGPASCGGRCSWIACAGTRRAGPGSRSARRRGAFCHRRCRRWWRCTDPARTRAGRAHRRAAVGRSTVRPCVIASTAARAKGTGKKRSSAQSGNRSR